MSAVDLIAKEEGFRSKPYYCSEGYPTVGYGQRIGPKGARLDLYQFSVPEPVAKEWLKSHVVELSVSVAAVTGHIDGVRQAALVSMAYQLGIAGLLGFSKTMKAVKSGDWQTAHDEALDSLWARQTPARAKRIAKMLLTGEWPE